MNKGISSIILCLTLFFGMNFSLHAQQNTVLQLKEDVLRLKEAEDLFEKGFYDEAIKKTELVMNSKELTRSEKEQVLLITAKINLELDKIEEVNKNIVTLLKTNPNYVLNPVMVQQDLYSYFQHYYVIPKLSFSIFGNYNSPMITGSNHYSLLKDVNYNASYKQDPSFGGGLDFTYSFRFHFFVSAGFQYNQFGFSRTLNGADKLQISYSEVLGFNEIPLMIGKRFLILPKQKLYVTLMAQASTMMIQSAKSNISVKYPVYAKDNNNTNLEYATLSERDIDRKSERQNMNSYGFNLELNKRISNLMIGVGASYRFTNQLLNKQDARYSNQRLIYTYNYIDNDFQMDIRQLYLKLNYTFRYSIKHKQIKETAAKVVQPDAVPENQTK